jgi:hypothetical protein
MARTKISVLTDPSYLSPHSRNTPCGHTVHPAIADYGDPQCSYCRMVNAMYDNRCSEDTIKARGGTHEWFEKCEWLHEHVAWAKATDTGVTRKSDLAPKKDMHRNNSSHRSAKARLHNVIIDLERMSAEEQAWEVARARLRSCSGNLGEGKKERMEHSATNALSLYHQTVRQGFMSGVEKDCAKFMRKRGRDWQVAADPEYPSSDLEIEPEVAHKRFKPSIVQRNLIAASSVLKVSTEVEPTPRRPKRRRVDDSIAFNEDAYVRSEADIDNLWSAPSFRNVSAPKATSSIQSILCTAARKTKRRRINPRPIDPRPSQPHYTRSLIKSNAPRPSRRWYRTSRAQAAGVYIKGPWAVPDDRVNLDTGGHKFGAKHKQ